MPNLSFFSRNKKKLVGIIILLVIIGFVVYYLYFMPTGGLSFGRGLSGHAETPYGESMDVHINVGGQTKEASFHASVSGSTSQTKYTVNGTWASQSKIQFQVQVQVTGTNIQNIKVNYLKVKGVDNADNSYHEYSAASYGYSFPDQIGTSPPASKTYTFPSSAIAISTHLTDCGASTSSATIKYYITIEVQSTGTKSGQTLTVTISYTWFTTNNYQQETESSSTTVSPEVLVTSFFSLENAAYAAIIAGIIIIILATRELYRLSKRKLTAEKKKRLRNLLKALIVAAFIALIISTLFLYFFSKPPNEDRAGNDTEWFSVRLIKDQHFTAAWQEGSNVQIKVTLQITYQNMQSTFTITIKVKAQDSSDASKYHEYPLYDAQDTFSSGEQKTYQTNVMTIEQHLQDLELSTSESHTIDYYIYFKVTGVGAKSGEQYTIEHQYEKFDTKTYTYCEPTPTIDEMHENSQTGTDVTNKLSDGLDTTYVYTSGSGSYEKHVWIKVSGDWSNVQIKVKILSYYSSALTTGKLSFDIYADGTYVDTLPGATSSSDPSVRWRTTDPVDLGSQASDGWIDLKFYASKSGYTCYFRLYELQVLEASASWFAFLFVPQNLLILATVIIVPAGIITYRRKKNVK